MPIARLLLSATLSAAALTSALHAEQWIQPTPEELALTSVPEAPGAPAIYLFREQVTEDKLHMYSIHARIKVLTAGGLDRANIELPYLSGGAGEFSLDELAGRTIHPDGSVVSFTGKPYDKFITRLRDEHSYSDTRYKAKVFSLPDVTPGSILEYHYKIRYSDHTYMSPDWYIQQDLFTRKVHYLWRPETHKELVTGDGRALPITSISWTPILPAGADFKQTNDARDNFSLELTAQNIDSFPTEDHTPPLDAFSYRVLFYLTPYRDKKEFWAKEGKRWSREEDHFIGPNVAVRAAAAELTAGADTPELKLHKLYYAVQQLENTDFSREHSSAEDKAEGFRKFNSTDDVLLRKRGSSNQLALLFVALARAAGFQAYAMDVTRRDRSIFFDNYLSLNQLDDTLAIVNLNGKEAFFDPGSRHCRFHELAWPHQMVEGLRQTTDGNSGVAATPGVGFLNSHVTRVGDLALDDHGVATGTLTLTYTGAPALEWRQQFSREDKAAVRESLTRNVQHMIPASVTLELLSLEGLADPEQVLTAKFKATGPVGSGAGKRLLVPADIFESNATPMFPSDKRKLGIDLHYTSYYQDAVRFKYPSSFTLESAPETAKGTFQQYASFDLSSQSAPGSITVRRNVATGQFLFLVSEYPGLRKFHQSLETADGEAIVFKQNPTAGASTTTADAGNTPNQTAVSGKPSTPSTTPSVVNP